MSLERVADDMEIRALLNRYARAVDTKDWELYRSVFTDDAGWRSRHLREDNVWFVNRPDVPA